MDETTTAAIFAAAGTEANWHRNQRGLETAVQQGGFTWYVQLPPESGRAYITGSSGWGGDTVTYVEATLIETIAIVDAAMAVTRIH